MALSDPQKVVRLRAIIQELLEAGELGYHDDDVAGRSDSCATCALTYRARQILKDTAPTEPTEG